MIDVEALNSLSKWLSANPSLLVLCVPLVSGMVGWGTAWYTNRRAHRSVKERMRFDRLMKVSEFRQAWINSLRDSMAEFQSIGITPGQSPAKNEKFYKSGTKIELLMNPADPDYDGLVECMYNFLEASEGNISQKYQNDPKYVELCQKILKREWERLKGELNDPDQYAVPGRKRNSRSLVSERFRLGVGQDTDDQ